MNNNIDLQDRIEDGLTNASALSFFVTNYNNAHQIPKNTLDVVSSLIQDNIIDAKMAYEELKDRIGR